MKTHCINLSVYESRGLSDQTMSVLWRPVKEPIKYVRRTVAPQEIAGEPKKHPVPYFDAYCSQPKTDANPRGMSEFWCWWDEYDRCGGDETKCPCGQPGDVLIGRERFRFDDSFTGNFDVDFGPKRIMYYADDNPRYRDKDTWRSAATMPAWAARHRHVVVSVGAKRCQDVTEEEASTSCEQLVLSPETLNGVPVHPMTSTYQEAFKAMINERFYGAWDANGWLWKTEVKREGA